jgi:ABC-type sugar transport system ATPase subunit
MAYLQLSNIEKFFGEHRAIKGIDLEIRRASSSSSWGRRVAENQPCCA